jgi:hypothetical protein
VDRTIWGALACVYYSIQTVIYGHSKGEQCNYCRSCKTLEFIIQLSVRPSLGREVQQVAFLPGKPKLLSRKKYPFEFKLRYYRMKK